MPALNQIIEHTLYLLVLMNPVSKIFILSVLAEEFPRDEMRRLITRSTWFALGILIILGIGGNLLLERVFHVQVHSLKVAAGIILFFIGYNALSKGVFFEVDEKQKHTDLSLVPLASPMIAGPATITAAISVNMEHGHISASLCITLAIALNFAVMLLYRRVSHWMNQRQLMGALIRITGLVIAAISVELVLSGLEDWWRAVHLPPR